MARRERDLRANRGENRILAVILDGEPHASRTPEDAERECFPKPLRHTVGEDGALTDTLVEPIAPDRFFFEVMRTPAARAYPTELWDVVSSPPS